MSDTIQIGNKTVGKGHPCFISFEVGATHSGMESARKLVQASVDAGADAVKFQTIFSDEILSEEDTTVDFVNAAGEKKKVSVAHAFERRNLTPDEWREIKAYCDERGILFISTPGGPRAVDLLVEIGAHAIKVSKSDINHRHLIRKIAASGLPVILDGREGVFHIATGLEICEECGNKNVMVMHCPSGYPADKAGIHLNAIPLLGEMFSCPIGYSDHSVGDHLNYVALALGTSFLEKTLTLDKTTDEVEHSMSLEPEEAKAFVIRLREAEAAFGDKNVIFTSRVNLNVRRSIRMATDVAEGKEITIDDITFLRPGTYFPVDQYETVIGAKARRDLKAGEWLKREDIESANT